MSAFMKNTVLAVLLAGFASLAWADTVKVTVNGMVCAFCAQGIEKRLSKLPATKTVFVDLKKKFVALEPQTGKTFDFQAIRAEIMDAGYDVVHMETVPQSIAELKAGDHK